MRFKSFEDTCRVCDITLEEELGAKECYDYVMENLPRLNEYELQEFIESRYENALGNYENVGNEWYAGWFKMISFFKGVFCSF